MTELSPYIKLVLGSFPKEQQIIPKGRYGRTNLFGLSGKNTLNLNPREAEKAITLLSGFYQDPDFIRRETGKVSWDPQTHLPSITLEDVDSNMCIDGQCFIEDTLDQGKDYVGLRITPVRQSSAPEIPFVRFDSFDNDRLILSEQNNRKIIVGVKTLLETNRNTNSLKYKDYYFQPGDRVEIFLDPKSITRPMINPQRPDPTVENVTLGGGFSLQVANYQPGQKSFTVRTDWVGNDINIRDISDPKSEPYRLSLTSTMMVNGDRLELPPQYAPSLDTAIASQNLELFAKYTLADFAEKNSRAMLNILKISLQLNPDVINTHGLKCNFATINENLVKTYCFDLESGSKEVSRWHKKQPPIFHYWPSDNPHLRQVIGDFRWQKPNLYQRYTSVLLAKDGIISESLEPGTALLDAATTKNNQAKSLSHFHTGHPQIDQSVNLHTRYPQASLATINQDLPKSLQTEISTFTNIYSIERLIGTLIPKLFSREVWDQYLVSQDKDTTVHQLDLNPQLSLLHIDLDGFELAYLLRHHRLESVHTLDSVIPASLQDVKAVFDILTRESDLPLNLVPAILNSLREGD